MNGHRNVVEVLLEKVDDLNRENTDGYSSFEIAINRGQRQTAFLLNQIASFN